MDLLEEIPIERLEIEFSGVAEVKWESTERSSSTGRSNMTDMVSAMDKENYLNQKLSLYTRDEKSRNFMVRRGRHVYPFRIQLPYNLPSTFTGDCYQIRLSQVLKGAFGATLCQTEAEV